jgi:hypothetical protein
MSLIHQEHEIELRQKYADIDFDALSEQVEIMRQIYAGELADKGPNAQDVLSAEYDYVVCNTVFVERLKSGEKFEDKRSLERLSAQYHAMDLGELGDLTSQFRKCYESALKDGAHVEKIMWEKRLMRAQDTLNERVGQRSVA